MTGTAFSEGLAGDPLLRTLAGFEAGAPRLGGVLLKRKLGEGSYGAVYLGLHTRLDVPVAVKILKGGESDDLSSFTSEARLLASLDHPHLVRILDFNCETSRGGAPVYYIVLEYIEGKNALELLHASLSRRSRPLDAAVGLEIGLACAGALGAAHARGVVHRDVKAENILVRDRDGVVKLADFGVARRLVGGDPATFIEGTRGFMAPETIAGAPPAPAADVYALGVTLYELVTGRLPWGEIDDGYPERQALRDPVDPRGLLDDFPDAAAAAILTSLERDPARRFPNGRAFAEALERALSELARRGAPAAALAAPGPAPAPEGGAEPRPPRVLCVDDDDISLEILENVLRKSGFAPVGYTDPRAALDGLAGAAPDVAVIDLHMPGMSGLELYREVRAREGFADLPVLAFSAQDDEDGIREALALGLADYLVKPVDAREVPIRVGLLLRMRALERERDRVAAEYHRRKRGLAAPARPEAAPTPPPTAPRGEVLVVDDDDGTRAVLRNALERAGHAVVEAEDGLAAIAAVARRRPDAVLLDMHMPRLSGVEACRRLRAGLLGRTVPVILVTVEVDPAAISAAFAAGVDDYLKKPADPAQVVHRVEAALARAGSAEAAASLRETLSRLF